ncbi:MAG: OmpA family protein [Pseudomonadota bacterium]
MRFFGVLLCLAALGLIGYSALTFKAPKIQADLEERTREVLLATAVNADVDAINVRADGRQITLEGPIANDDQRQRVLDAVSALPGVLRTVDRLDPSDATSPYRLGAVKDPNGEVVVTGYAPDGSAKMAIVTTARALFGDDARITIDLADGAPKEGWAEAAAAALDAFAITLQGSLSIANEEILLDAKVTSEADIDAIEFFSEMVPDGYLWTNDLSVGNDSDPQPLEVVAAPSVSAEVETSAEVDTTVLALERQDSDSSASSGSGSGQAAITGSERGNDPVSTERRRVAPYTFSVVKDQQGGLFLKGFAPDKAARDVLIDAGKNVGDGLPVIADIEIADGVPDDEWLSMVQAGINAMQDMQSGRLDIVDSDVAFTSNPNAEANDADELGEATVATSPGGSQLDTAAAEIAAPQPASSAGDSSVDAALLPDSDATNEGALALVVDKVDEDAWSIRGLVPGREAEDELVAAIKDHAGVDDVDVELDHRDGDADDDWVRFANRHIRTLDVVRAGRLQLKDREAHLIGVVGRPEDIKPVQDVLAAINDDMTVDLQPVDPRPLATLSLKVLPNGEVSLSGALPDGLNEQEAIEALGINRFDGELREGARGSVNIWREELASLSAFLPIFDEIDLTLNDATFALNGEVHLHADAVAVADEMTRALGDNRQPLVEIATTSTVRMDGEIRTSPLTGQEEFYHRGYWLPVVNIAADDELCGERSSAMLATDKITFLRGQETLDQRAERLLNALAGLAIACLGSGDLVLEIGGHTDSRGAEQMNQDLSQARADAVLNALAARGVNVDALIAIGHGERQPIADNSTDDGRAANRRITFEWSVSKGTDGSDSKS